MIIHSNQYPFPVSFFLPLTLEKLIHQNDYQHINGFEKGLRQATFFHQEVDAADSKFDVNKDVVDGSLSRRIRVVRTRRQRKSRPKKRRRWMMLRRWPMI